MLLTGLDRHNNERILLNEVVDTPEILSVVDSGVGKAVGGGEPGPPRITMDTWMCFV
jgi:hypothetical protein